MDEHLLRNRLRTRLRYLTVSGRLRRRMLYGAGGLLLLAAAWIAVTGYLVGKQVQRLEANLQRVKALVAQGQLVQARQVASDIPSITHRAHLLTTGPAWWAAAQVPYFGEALDVVRGATAAAQEVGDHGVPALLDVAADIDPSRLRTAGDTVDLAPLESAAPRLGAAAAVLDDAVRRIDALPTGTWLGAVDGPRAAVASQLKAISGYVDAAARAAKVLPPMLGSNSPKRYFVGLQNEAEMRGTGGLPGAFAIVVADHGKVTFTHFESDAALLPAESGQLIPTGLDFGADYDAAYGASDPTSLIVNSDLSPHFPYAAQIWARMWERVSGEHVDGAVAVDPTVLAYLLAATGPATLPGGGTVTADNVVTLTERDEYSIFDDNAARKDFLVSVLKASSTLLTSGRGDATVLAQAMTLASKEQRLLVWSADPAVEDALAQTSYAGSLPTGNRPFVGPVLNNVAAGKLDFYLTRSLDYHRSGCGASRDVLVTLTLANNAPGAGLPLYVTTRLDVNGPGTRPGDDRTQLDYYATAGAELMSVSVNGEPTTAAVLHALGHPIFRLAVELPRGTTQTVVLHLREPAGTGDPIIWRQPGVTPMAVTAFSQPCG